MGKLYVIGTPIGNLEDITLRALRILGEVDLIAAEDTRRTRKLLSHYDISVRLFSYRRENEAQAAGELTDRIAGGMSIALVSDAGMPGISDPGQILVAECVKRGIDVEVVPGCSSVTAVLAIAGVPISSFIFEGYLPSKSIARRSRLLELSGENRPVVFFEAPHRIKGTIEDLAELLPERELILARELTKMHEEVLRGNSREVFDSMKGKEGRGEYVGLLIPSEREEPASAAPGQLAREVQDLLDKGVARGDAFRMTAAKWGISRRVVYQAYLQRDR